MTFHSTRDYRTHYQKITHNFLCRKRGLYENFRHFTHAIQKFTIWEGNSLAGACVSVLCFNQKSVRGSFMKAAAHPALLYMEVLDQSLNYTELTYPSSLPA
ncbi:unnamed protein product [Natator depressus]